MFSLHSTHHAFVHLKVPVPVRASMGVNLINGNMTTTTSSSPATFGNGSSKVSVPVLGVGDRIGEGDTYLVANVLPPELAEVAFEDLMKEVAWNVMHHRGPSCSHVLKNTSDLDT